MKCTLHSPSERLFEIHESLGTKSNEKKPPFIKYEEGALQLLKNSERSKEVDDVLLLRS